MSWSSLPITKFKYVDSLAVTYVTSLVAAMNAELVTYPLDLIKTRLQLQGEGLQLAAKGGHALQKPYRGTRATIVGIINEEGFFMLWRGMSAMIYRHIIYTGARVCLYDLMRKRLAATDATGKLIAIPVWQSAACGLTAGALAQWITSPANLVKVQIQMEGKRRLEGEPARVHGPIQGLREIWRHGGLRAMWKGSSPNVVRSALVNLGDLTAYDVFKRLSMEKLEMPDSRPIHFIASIGAGCVAAFFAAPTDMIKTRVMNQPTDVQGRGLLYRGSIDCFNQIIAKEGVMALYKGFVPCSLRLAPWTFVFWMTFEQIKYVIGGSGY